MTATMVKGGVKERGETCDVTNRRSKRRSKKRRGNPQTRQLSLAATLLEGEARDLLS